LIEGQSVGVDFSVPNLLSETANRYFGYTAERFPVMCASDEFHFIPRSQAASEQYDKMEDLSLASIQETTANFKEIERELNSLPVEGLTFEESIDLELLKKSLAGVLIEFEKNRSLLHNPLLYLKIAFIGLDHALHKPARNPEERLHRIISRLQAVPEILAQAGGNIKNVPETYVMAARAMIDDCREYLNEISQGPASGIVSGLDGYLSDILTALVSLNRFLKTVPVIPDGRSTAASLQTVLRDHFGSVRDLTEIFEIADQEGRTALLSLKKTAREIDPDRSWLELYHGHFPPEIGETDTISLYGREIENLRSFFKGVGFKEGDIDSPLELAETPTYLRSVRSAASFAAAFSPDEQEKSYFYISPDLPEPVGRETRDLLKKRLHREYKFLSAHETVPGHHLLDSTRRRLDNPIRRQIESPLFYEGWAYYAESLLTDYGYLCNPIDRLVDYKRRLWRSVRCRIDVGLPTGIIKRDDAVNLLIEAGFAKGEADRQLNRFQLNPGYQLCYSLGRYEIVRLRNLHARRLGRERFHSILMESGQAPFHLIAGRYESSFHNDQANSAND